MRHIVLASLTLAAVLAPITVSAAGSRDIDMGMRLPDGNMELPDGNMELPDGNMELPRKAQPQAPGTEGSHVIIAPPMESPTTKMLIQLSSDIGRDAGDIRSGGTTVIPDDVWIALNELLSDVDCKGCEGRYCCLEEEYLPPPGEPASFADVGIECNWGCCPTSVRENNYLEYLSPEVEAGAGVLWIFCCLF